LQWVSRGTPAASSALPLRGTHTASPKTISRRTSYYRVRLEFLRYPQLISACCTAREFGPPGCLTIPSTWPWIAHSVSGCVYATKTPVKTRFPYGFGPEALNLATYSTLAGSFFNRNTVVPFIPEGIKLGLQLFVDIRFQRLFHRPFRAAFHLSLTVLVHYRSLFIFSLTR
jgi:hypothetical protein